MRTIIYTRVSTQAQNESGLGLEAQQAECKIYADRFEWEIGGIYTDSVSGASEIDKRPELLNALADLKRGDVFMVYKLDRLARDGALSAIIERDINRKGATLVSVCGEGTAADDDDLGAFVQKRMFTMFAEIERKMIQTRTKQALKAKRAKGERTGGSIPFGYDVDTQGETQILIPNQAEQATIKEIMTERTQGASIRLIADKLNDKQANGKAWHQTAIRRIMKRHSVDNYWGAAN